MRRLLVALALLAFAAPMSAQAAKPSFVGSWTMDASRSVSEGTALPAAINWTIAQHGDTLVWDREIVNEAGGQKLVSKVTVALDGKTWPNKAPQADGSTRDAAYTITWEGATMVVTITSVIEETPIAQIDRMTKGADGTTFTVVRTLMVDGEEAAKATMVFTRPRS